MQTLKLADGSEIDLNGKLVKPLEKEKPAAKPLEKISTHRLLEDLPASGKVMHTVALVGAYTIWGLRAQDIATLLNTTVEQIEMVRADDLFKRFFQELLRSVLDSELEDIRDRIVTKARTALLKLEEVLDDDDSKVKLNAANSILDRAGFRPADIVEHKHKVEGALKIVYEQRGKTTQPAIDVEFEETDGNG